MSYEGANQAILRLQMRLMGWDVDIVHRRNEHLVDANYWSRLDADLCYDPSFRSYLHLVESLRAKNPAPTEIPMLPEHMPYYRGPRIHGKTIIDLSRDVDVAIGDNAPRIDTEANTYHYHPFSSHNYEFRQAFLHCSQNRNVVSKGMAPRPRRLQHFFIPLPIRSSGWSLPC
jgi:hypothetical protein